MARSANNLTISISADSSKLRADMALATAELRKLKKEEQAAAKALAEGTGSTAALKEISKQADVATRKVRALSTAYGGFTRANVEATSGVKGLAEGLGSLRNGLAAIAGITGVREAISGFTDALAKMREVANTSAGTGFKPETVAGFTAAMREAGSTGEKSASALVQFAGARDTEQKASQQAEPHFMPSENPVGEPAGEPVLDAQMHD